MATMPMQQQPMQPPGGPTAGMGEEGGESQVASQFVIQQMQDGSMKCFGFQGDDEDAEEQAEGSAQTVDGLGQALKAALDFFKSGGGGDAQQQFQSGYDQRAVGGGAGSPAPAQGAMS